MSNFFLGYKVNTLLTVCYKIKRMLNDTIWVNGLKKAFGYDPLLCKCGTQMILNLELSDFHRKEGYG